MRPMPFDPTLFTPEKLYQALGAAPLKQGADAHGAANAAPLNQHADAHDAANAAPLKQDADAHGAANAAPLKQDADGHSAANAAPLKQGADAHGVANAAPLKQDAATHSAANKRLRYKTSEASLLPESWVHPPFKVSIVGLGDVGANLLLGLRLLGSPTLREIGIYARKEETLQRFLLEMNQVSPAFGPAFPPVVPLQEDQLFDADVFLFCASKQVPPIGATGDVRLMQLAENRQILRRYAAMAREKKFRGIFAVVSDPVDLLCLCALEDSNRDEHGVWDGLGLQENQIRGFGLGVMNARALYYAAETPGAQSYNKEGRAYGPHGQGLVLANSIEHYDDEVSRHLTQKVLEANLKVRSFGFKPYIAPALSSGSLSILSMLRGEPHYSAVYVEGVYLGICNRLGAGIERQHLPDALFQRIAVTHSMLLSRRAELIFSRDRKDLP